MQVSTAVAQTTTTQVIPLEKRVSDAVVVFDSKKIDLTALAEKYKDLKVSDINDNKQVKVVDDARKDLKKERCDIQNQGKAIRASIKELTDNVSAKEKELTGIISPIETALEAEVARVESERERIKQEAEAKRRAIIEGRVKQLIDLGCTFDGSRYAIGDRSVALIVITEMSDELFDKTVYQFAEVATAIEDARKHNERIKAEAQEVERLQKEAEKKQMEAERAELEKLRAEQAKREEAIKAEQERNRLEAEKIEAEKRAIEQEKVNKERERVEKLVAARSSDLKFLGLVEFADHYSHPIYEKTGVDKSTLETATPEQWNELTELFSKRIEAGKQAAEQKRLAELEAAKEQARKEEAERIAAENKRKEEEAAAQESEAKRQAALAPDKDKLMAFADNLSKLELPTVESEAAKKITDDVKALIAKIQNHIHSKVKSL
jgi:DNA repair exonuclease SbcCD ATPase subunit